MKHLALTVMAVLAFESFTLTAQTASNAPDTNAAAPVAAVSTNVAVSNAAVSTNVVLIVGAGAPVTNAAVTNAPDVTVLTDITNVTPTNAVRMNFHDAPLGTVLKYLSARLGFVIATETDIRGTITIVSEQPVDKEEVINLLSSALAKNNYSVARNGRILTIGSVDGATTGYLTPVIEAANATNIPVSDEIATVILPVQTLNPNQLIKDLDQLIPNGAKVTANEAGNAVIMTARQKDIHRFAEIIGALDSSSVSEVHVFPLNFADAKAVASELKEIFQSPDSSVARSDARSRFRGGGFFGGGGPFGGGGGGSDNSDQKNSSNKAVFVSDDQRNAVVASAPPSYFSYITNVIAELDKPSEDITEVHTFHLKYADAQEMADEISNLFPDETKASSDQSSGRTYGFRMFTPPWAQTQSAGSGQSERMKRQTTVRAVPDMRTHSLTVTASKDQLVLITKMIEDLDNNPSGTQKVFVYDIDSADPITVQQTMTALFAGPNTRAPQTTTTSALSQRENSAAQQQTQPSTSGFGSGSGTSSLR
jgi:type II secretory pathway component GspD/PulD (secretin)